MDATVGWGGHAQRLLERLAPGGHLLGIDADPMELPRTEARFRRLGFDEAMFTPRRTNFAGLRVAIDSVGWHDGADFVLADLGVSSMQIDNPARGLTFGADGRIYYPQMSTAEGRGSAQTTRLVSVTVSGARRTGCPADPPHCRSRRRRSRLQSHDARRTPLPSS